MRGGDCSKDDEALRARDGTMSGADRMEGKSAARAHTQHLPDFLEIARPAMENCLDGKKTDRQTEKKKR